MSIVSTQNSCMNLYCFAYHNLLLSSPCCFGIYIHPPQGHNHDRNVLTSRYRVKSMPANEAAITAARQPLKFVEAAERPNSASTQQ